jgi:hypothetical protein
MINNVFPTHDFILCSFVDLSPMLQLLRRQFLPIHGKRLIAAKTYGITGRIAEPFPLHRNERRALRSLIETAQSGKKTPHLFME